MNKKYDYIVYIGRFMPAHNAHIATIKKALTLSDNVIILLGSANQARTIKNPWTWDERAKMIRSCFSSAEWGLIHFAPIEDSMYNDQQWVVDVQSRVDETIKQVQRRYFKQTGEINLDSKVGLIGFEKDDSSYYLKMFPQWKFENMDKVETSSAESLNSTNVRVGYFELGITPGENYAPKPIQTFLHDWMTTEDYKRLVREYDHIHKYQMSWAGAPYAPTFVTADAVVITAGHVLVVRRKSAPGEGLVALPGGFLDPGERIKEGMLRELREETKLKVPEPVLRGSIKNSNVFDHPNRSLRGRTITHAFLIELEPSDQGLPKVKGGSDAQKAEWIPLSQALTMGNQWFEDHLQIVKYFVGEV